MTTSSRPKRSCACCTAAKSVAVGDVEGDRQQPLAVGLDEVVEGGGVAGGRGDVVASLECGDRPLATEPTGRSGDEPRFRHAFDAMTSSALQRKPGWFPGPA